MKNKSKIAILISLSIFFIAGVLLIFNTENSFGGADNIAHYFGAHYGWKYPQLLFNHWNKPVFTLLASPFAQAGFNGMRVYNLILGLLTARLTYKSAESQGLGNSIFVFALTLFAPVYFILMFTGLTEITFSFFLILGVYLFFKDKFLLSALVISFLPMIRNEGFVLFPFFALAYASKKSYISILALASGFVVISIAGLPFHSDFLWLIKEIPYSASSSSIYGSGPWYHFLANTDKTTGWIEFLLFVTGFVVTALRYLRSGFLRFGRDFYTLLIIFLPFIAYLSAHSLVWYLGTGGSLGLLRVVGALVPLSALGALIGFNILLDKIKNRNKTFASSAVILLSIFMFYSAFRQGRRDFSPSEEMSLMRKAASYIGDKGLKNRFIVYYDVNLIYYLGIDPYDESRVKWMLSPQKEPSLPLPPGAVVVWDSHFGPNEGKMPVEYLMRDPYLTLIKTIKPRSPFKTLNDYDYVIYIFQKKDIDGGDFIRSFLLDFNEKRRREDTDSLCFEMTPQIPYSPGFVVNTAYVCDSLTSFELRFSVDIKAFKDIESLYAVVSLVDNKHPVYQTVPVVFKPDGSWHHFKYTFGNVIISPENKVFKVYLWNKDGERFLMDNFKVELIPSAVGKD